jgi:hypothetical protein
MAMLAAVVWALLWQPVGRAFGWWAGAGAFLAGGAAGLLAGWLFVEWLNRLRPHDGRWVRTVAELAGVACRLAGFVALPLWVLARVRVG